jgi:hypothetical protein
MPTVGQDIDGVLPVGIETLAGSQGLGLRIRWSPPSNNRTPPACRLYQSPLASHWRTSAMHCIARCLPPSRWPAAVHKIHRDAAHHSRLLLPFTTGRARTNDSGRHLPSPPTATPALQTHQNGRPPHHQLEEIMRRGERCSTSILQLPLKQPTLRQSNDANNLTAQ